MKCCMCGKDLAGQPAMVDRATGEAFCPQDSSYFGLHPSNRPARTVRESRPGAGAQPPPPVIAAGQAKPSTQPNVEARTASPSASGRARRTKEGMMGFLSKLFGKQSTGLRRLSLLAPIGEWGCFLTSKQGDKIIRLYGGVEIPAGEWLCFLYHLETQPDHRIIFSDAACVWLNVPKPVTLSGPGNMFYPIPKEIKGFIVEDGARAEWSNAPRALDLYLSKDDGLKFQWSWRTDRVKRIASGECTDWVSKKAA